MFCYILGEAAVDEFFYSGFTFKLSFFFLGFQHASGTLVKVIMRLLPLVIGLKCFWFLLALLLYLRSTILKLSFLYLKTFAYQTSFQENLGKTILSVGT